MREKGGGEAGIRTLGRGLCPFNGLANRRLQPLGHLTASAQREPASAGRTTDNTTIWPDAPPFGGPVVGRAPVRHSITHSPACGPDRYSGGASAVISVSSSRMIETACPPHSGTGTVTANSSDTQSPSFSVIRGWSP